MAVNCGELNDAQEYDRVTGSLFIYDNGRPIYPINQLLPRYAPSLALMMSVFWSTFIAANPAKNCDARVGCLMTCKITTASYRPTSAVEDVATAGRGIDDRGTDKTSLAIGARRGAIMKLYGKSYRQYTSCDPALRPDEDVRDSEGWFPDSARSTTRKLDRLGQASLGTSATVLSIYVPLAVHVGNFSNQRNFAPSARSRSLKDLYDDLSHALFKFDAYLYAGAGPHRRKSDCRASSSTIPTRTLPLLWLPSLALVLHIASELYHTSQIYPLKLNVVRAAPCRRRPSTLGNVCKIDERDPRDAIRSVHRPHRATPTRRGWVTLTSSTSGVPRFVCAGGPTLRRGPL
ncbi:hypothetical protein EV714DRAFT_239830 [Schizophyllum commune]